MFSTALPRYAFRDTTDISPDFLKALGVRFLMLDLDNTVAAYSERRLAEDVSSWAANIRDCGVGLFLITNSMKKPRVDTFAEALDIGFLKGARKPSPKSLLQTMESVGFLPGESALVGDQIFTDTIAANRAGIISIIVHPRRLMNPILALRYAVETPFRAACKNKMWDIT